MRNRRGTPVHGWVILDKPPGVTSTQAVGAVKRIFNARKAGHAGTLDPLATGVLAVALGEATKTVPYVMDAPKTYRFTARWGEARDTDDCEGEVTATSPVRPSRAAIEAVLDRFVGEIIQVPPAYSAVKVAGERAYDLARDGVGVQLEPRPVWVESARLLALPDAGHAEFEMVCGKGAYVRAWVRDLARALGTVGHVAALRRERVGPFSAAAAIPLEKLKGLMHSPAALEHLRPLATALDGIPALAVTGPDVLRLRSGNPILVRAPVLAQLADKGALGDETIEGLTVFCATAKGEPVALAELERGELKPFRVFNLGN